MEVRLTTIRGRACIESEAFEAAAPGGVKYIAKIQGTDPNYGFDRKFLKRVEPRSYSGVFFSVGTLHNNDLIEVGGASSSKVRLHFQVERVGHNELVLLPMTRANAIALASTLDEPVEVEDSTDVPDGYKAKAGYKTKKRRRGESVRLEDTADDDILIFEEDEEPIEVPTPKDLEGVRDLFRKKS